MPVVKRTETNFSLKSFHLWHSMHRKSWWNGLIIGHSVESSAVALPQQALCSKQVCILSSPRLRCFIAIRVILGCTGIFKSPLQGIIRIYWKRLTEFLCKKWEGVSNMLSLGFWFHCVLCKTPQSGSWGGPRVCSLSPVSSMGIPTCWASPRLKRCLRVWKLWFSHLEMDSFFLCELSYAF